MSLRRAAERVGLVVVAFACAATIVTMGAPPAAADDVAGAGTLLAVAPLPESHGVAGAQRALRLEYVTTGPGGVPMTSTGALYVPEGEPPSGGWPIIARAHGTVGVGDSCAPTVTGPRPDLKDYVATWLREGFALVATDYAGLGTPGVHPYLDGDVAGHSVIDSVRAARAAEPDLSTRWAVIGTSQGGHASLFTAHMATASAPELDFRGAVANAPPSGLEYVVPLLGPYVPRIPLDGTTSYFAYLVYGLRAARPDLDVNSYLSPRGIEVLNSIESMCIDVADRALRDVPLGELFSRPLWNPAIATALREMLQVPVAGYDRPILLVQGLSDRVVPPPATAVLYAQMVAHGVDVTLLTFPVDHVDIVFASLPDAIRFVHAIMSP